MLLGQTGLVGHDQPMRPISNLPSVILHAPGAAQIHVIAGHLDLAALDHMPREAFGRRAIEAPDEVGAWPHVWRPFTCFGSGYMWIWYRLFESLWQSPIRCIKALWLMEFLSFNFHSWGTKSHNHCVS